MIPDLIRTCWLRSPITSVRCVRKRLESGLLNPKVLGVNIKTLLYQVPGGMLSNLVSQLKEQGKEDKYQEVLEEVPRVRKDLGEPPLVTPSSQIVGTQAVLNVTDGRALQDGYQGDQEDHAWRSTVRL